MSIGEILGPERDIVMVMVGEGVGGEGWGRLVCESGRGGRGQGRGAEGRLVCESGRGEFGIVTTCCITTCCITDTVISSLNKLDPPTITQIKRGMKGIPAKLSDVISIHDIHDRTDMHCRQVAL